MGLGIKRNPWSRRTRRSYNRGKRATTIIMRIMRFVALALLLTSTAQAELPKVSSGRIERLEAFPSKHVAARNVDVWLPDGYPDAAPYAVLYMQDGQMLFDATQTWNKQEWHADEVASGLIRSGKTRPFIIVGVWNNDPQRHSEYFPQRPFARLSSADQARLYAEKRGDKALFGQPVQSDSYLRFLVTELKPHIDQHYAVDPAREQTVVMGSSMGGLISMYALAEYPDVFGAAACLSTHWAGTFEPDDRVVQQAFYDYLDTRFPAPGRHRIYFDHGDATLDAWYPPLQTEVDRRLHARGYQFPRIWSLSFPGADHSEVSWAKRLHVPLQFLLPPQP